MRAVSAQRFARWFLVLTVTFLVIFAAPFAIRAIFRARANAECEHALWQIHAALKTYVQNGHDDLYPALSRDPGRMTFEASFISTLGPEIDSTLWRDDNQYWYLGWMVPNERSGLEWIEQYRAHAPNIYEIPAQDGVWPEFEVDIAVRQRELDAAWLAEHPDGKPHPNHKEGWPIAHPNWEERRFYCPFRDGMERFLITEIGNPLASSNMQSLLPIIVERPELHGDGGHVLYMEGHVEFVQYPGKFPMTPKFIEGLRSLDALERATQ